MRHQSAKLHVACRLKATPRPVDMARQGPTQPGPASAWNSNSTSLYNEAGLDILIPSVGARGGHVSASRPAHALDWFRTTASYHRCPLPGRRDQQTRTYAVQTEQRVRRFLRHPTTISELH